MSRIQTIIKDARESLGDQDKERWTDERLLQLVSSGQKDLARYSKILKGQHTLTLNVGEVDYTLPDYIWMLTRASYDNTYIPFKSHDDFDRKEVIQALSPSQRNSFNVSDNFVGNTDFGTSSWETDTGTRVYALVYDRRNLSEIRIYPELTDAIVTSTYTFVNGGIVEFVGDEELGIVVAIDDYTFTSPYGIVVDLLDPEIEKENFNSPYGVVTSIDEVEAELHLWYLRDPIPLVTVLDELETPSIFDEAIRYYVIGHAFLDDLDTRSKEKSTTFLQLYQRELDLAENTSSHDGVRKAATHETSYRSAF